MARAANGSNPILLRDGMSIGTGNAESDDEFLFDCFVHYPPVERCLNVQSPAMIISGRTGSGKTAILRYIDRTVENSVEIDPSEMSMNYVSNSDALRFLYAIGADLDLLFQVLWKHVLCIEFIRLRWQVENEVKSRNVFDRIVEKFKDDDRKKRAVKYLKEWEGKFWITMDQNIREITESVENKLKAEFGGEIEKFKAGGQYEKRLSMEKKSELVARSRSIINADQLTDLHGIIDVLASSASAGRMAKFYILIDKLDEKWVDDTVRFRLIRSLISCLKSFRKITDLKILVALRADVLERVVQETHDLSFQREKFEDAFVRLKWTSADLRLLVDKRLNELFRRQYSGSSISYSDIFPARVGTVDSFQYIVDRTLMRPRDVIAFINECLSRAEGHHQVSIDNIRRAEIDYARKRRDALEQEWRSAFPSLGKILTFFGSKKALSLSLDDMRDGPALDDLALNICALGKVDHDPMFESASVHVETSGKSDLFLQDIAALLYRTGAAGVKLNAEEKIMYSHIDEPLISRELIGSTAKVRIHPMLHGAFRIHEPKSA